MHTAVPIVPRFFDGRSAWIRSLVLFLVLFLGTFSLLSLGSVSTAHADGIIGTISLGQPPSGVAVNSVTDTIYTINGHGIVNVINGSTDAITNSLSVKNGTFSIAVDPKTNLVYVGNAFYNQITVINGSTNKIVTTIQNVNGEQVTVNPNTNTIFTLGSIINGSTNALIANITTGCGQAGATTIGVNTVTNTVFATAAYSVGAPTPPQFCLTEINGSTGAIVNVLEYGQQTAAGPLAVDTNTNTVYEGYQGTTGGTIYTINGSTDTQIGDFTGPKESAPVAFDQQTNLLYVVGSSSLAVFDGSTNTLVETLNLANASGAAAINPSTNRVYIANYDGDSIYVVQGLQSPNTTISSSTSVAPSINSTSTSSTSSSSSSISSPTGQSVTLNHSSSSSTSVSSRSSSTTALGPSTSGTITTVSSSQTASSSPSKSSLSAQFLVVIAIVGALIGGSAILSLRRRGFRDS